MKRIARTNRRTASHHLPRQARPQRPAADCVRDEPRQNLLSAAEMQALMAVAAGEDPAKAWRP